MNINEIHIDVFCDEIHRVKGQNNSDWIYFGILFIPTDKEQDVANNLLNSRCIQHESWNWEEQICENKCGYHSENNTEIKYEKLMRSDARRRIASKWLKNVLIEDNNFKNKRNIYFNILGINLSLMNLDTFGTDRFRDLNIYNRFFRTALISGAKYFFHQYPKIIINRIFHDIGAQKDHPIFSWHAPYKININTDSNLSSLHENIFFIDSDHRNYPNQGEDYRIESQFIQFIDLILGSIFCCLHNPTDRIEKKEIGLIIKPLLERILRDPLNKNSSYNYYRKQRIEFFPKYKISGLQNIYHQLDLNGGKIETASFSPNFYTNRPILLQQLDQTQLERFND